MPQRLPRVRRPAAKALTRPASQWQRAMVRLAGGVVLADAPLSTIWGEG